MAFLELLEVACAPILQVLLVSALGAFLATGYCDHLLSPDFRKSLNKLVFLIFTPSLVFASFARSVSLDDMISWWFMPVNVGLTFLIGGTVGWIIVKFLKPNLKLEGLIIACTSSGNLGNLPIVIIPAICDQKGGPFGLHDACRSAALSYSSFSMALGGVFIWTYTYQIMRSRSMKYKALEAAEAMKLPNKDPEANSQANLLTDSDKQDQIMEDPDSSNVNESFWHRFVGTLGQVLHELKAPPTIATFSGFVFGGIPWLRNLIVGENAPFGLIQDTLELLGQGTIPCITILLGGNLTQGLQSSKVKLPVIISVIVAKFMIIPAIGLLIVRTAASFHWFPADPLFQYVLVLQYAMPPAMNISTMAQLFDVGQEECSVILLWTYSAAAIALTVWSTVLMWMLS